MTKHRKEYIQLQEAGASILKLVRLMTLTIAPLQADLKFASSQWEHDKQNQFWRRTVIRCLLALLEAVLWNMKCLTPKVASLSEVNLSVKEMEFAEDRIRPFPKFRKNVAQTFELFAKVFGVTYSPNYDADFDALCITYELRNRLMHPKTTFDPDVSDENIGDSLRAARWFQQEFDKVMGQCGAVTDKIIGDATRRRLSEENYLK